MCRRGRWPLAKLLAACVLSALGAGQARAGPAGPAPAAWATADERLVLAASRDGVPLAGDPILVRRRGGAIWADSADLRALGVPVGALRGEVPLDAVPGLRFRVDGPAQVIDLSWPEPERQRVSIAAPPLGPGPSTLNGWGAVINYDVSATHAPTGRVAAGLVESVVFAPHGYGFASAILLTGGPGVAGGATRLDTGVTVPLPNRVARLTVGDFIGGATSWSRPVRMMGVQFGTDFALRPDLLTFPLPSIGGRAAVPSTVDLVVNGAKLAARDVKAGQFSVADVPVQTGLNTISVAVRDSLGRQTIRTVAAYASPALLRPGLSAVSAEAGLVRVGYGTRADRYRDLAASASLRLGLFERATLQAHGELGAGTASAGAGAVLGLGRWGLLDASASASAPAVGRKGGAQVALGWERIAHPVNLSARYVRASRGWSDLASRYGSADRSRSLVLNIGFDLGRLGNVGASLVDLGRGRLASGRRVDRSSFAVGTYSVRLLRRVNLVGNMGGDFARGRSFYLSLGALAVFGPGTSAGVSVTRRSDGASVRADYVHSALEAGDWGYRANLATGGVNRVAAGVEHLGAHGRVEALVEHTNGATAAQLSARGALVMAGGGVFLSDRIGGAFAVVDTGGRGGVAVFRDNRRAGVSDRRGKLVVANLRAYEATKIAIDPAELDPGLTIGRDAAVIRPAERAGVAVSFGLRLDTSIRVRLIDRDGAPLPAGSRAAVNESAALPVGFDGALYIPEPARLNRLVVTLPDGSTCSAGFAADAAREPIRCVTTVLAQLK